MSTIKNFFSDLRQSLSENPFISDKSIGCAVGEFLKYALAPFLLSLAFGMFAIIGDELWSKVFISAVKEFVQLIGLTILLGAIVTNVGICFVLYKFVAITLAISWFTKTLCHIAFSMTSILFGVIWGLVIPATLESNDKNTYLDLTLFLSLPLLFATVFFYSASKIFLTNGRSEINKAFGMHTQKATLALGIILIAISFILLFFNDTWANMVIEPLCEVKN